MRNEVIYKKIKVTLSRMEQEVRKRSIAESRLEEAQYHLAWEMQKRTYLQRVAERHLLLPVNWLEILRRGQLTVASPATPNPEIYRDLPVITDNMEESSSEN